MSSTFGNGGGIIMVDDSEADLHLAERCYERSRVANPWRAFAEVNRFLRHLFDEVLAGTAPMPALVLLDLNMPEMDGFEVLDRIRAHPRFGELPAILVFTHSDRESDRQRALQKGATRYWIKPSDVDSYVELFDSLLDHGVD